MNKKEITTRCRVCNTILTQENWAPSNRRDNRRICRPCASAYNSDYRHRHGGLSMNENKKCPAFLGVHVAERVLSMVFKNVKRMPFGNPGYDFICGKGYKIDVKSSCIRPRIGHSDDWRFHIRENKIADYFLCIAFDNRENLNPLHVWLIPAADIIHIKNASIAVPTISKWDDYVLDISKVTTCCNILKEE